jgi:hypothetical protein
LLDSLFEHPAKVLSRCATYAVPRSSCVPTLLFRGQTMKQVFGSVLHTREAYLVKRRSLRVLTFHASRFTFHERRGTS